MEYDQLPYYHKGNRQRTKDLFGTIFNKIHCVFTATVTYNKYIKSFIREEICVDGYLNDKVWNIKLSIYTNKSLSLLVHEGRLTAPNMEEIATLLLDNSSSANNHIRLIIVNYRNQEAKRRYFFMWGQ